MLLMLVALVLASFYGFIGGKKYWGRNTELISKDSSFNKTNYSVRRRDFKRNLLCVLIIGLGQLHINTHVSQSFKFFHLYVP